MAILTLLMIFASANPMLGIGRTPSGDLPPLKNLSADELANAKELWTGEVVIWQEDGALKAAAIFHSYDEDYFRRNGFHPGLIEKGLELQRQETELSVYKWEAVFLIPDELGFAPLHTKVLVDNSGNVFYTTNTWPKGRCDSIFVLGRRTHPMNGSIYKEALLFKPHIYGIQISGMEHAGIPCPSF